jgi:peptidoglycan/xylan/chitin deacetylase (PgdA/CDA1 family)
MPVLLSHGFSATNFVVSGRMGWGSYMTAGQVQAADQMGFTIGAHTVNHVALAAAAPGRALWEIRQSKATLEGLLGHAVADFAYPYGSFNAYDEAQVRQLGFEAAASTIAGSLHWPTELMHLHRIRVDGGMSLAAYAHLVGGPPPSAAEAAIAAGVLPSPTVSPVQPAPTPVRTIPPTPVASATPAASATPIASATPSPSGSSAPSH